MRDDSEQGQSSGVQRLLARARGLWQAAYDQNALLRQLVHEPLFLVALAGLVLSTFTVALMLPKIWNPAPAHFSKTVRVSLLDYVQSWALRRSARAAHAQERWDDAFAAWRGALGNNIASVENHRGTLDFLRRAPWVQSANIALVIFSSDVLLELTHTNRADALLAADVLERHRVPELAISVLQPIETHLDATGQVVLARAFLSAGRTADFVALRSRWSSGTEGDPVLQLYLAALDAGGSPDRAVSGLERLRAALDRPPHRFEAARLLCIASMARNSLPDYERALGVLRELESIVVQDEAGWWELLAQNDRRDEALELARNYKNIPPTPFEAVQLVQAWANLGLSDLALEFLKENAERYGVTAEVWGAYFDLLIQGRDWNEVRRIAANLRVAAASRDEVLAVSWYADAIAELSAGRRVSAREALDRLRSVRIENARLGERMAAGLLQVHEHQTAWDLLRQIEKDRGHTPQYWNLVVACAQARRDVPGMRNACNRLLEIDPGNTGALSLKLGLLLVTREAPAAALALSLRLQSAGGNSTGFHINHAVALLQNQRLDEAEAVLAAINPGQLPDAERVAWRMARAEAYGQRGRFADALSMGSLTLDELDLAMPPEVEWFKNFLDECRRQAGRSSP